MNDSVLNLPDETRMLDVVRRGLRDADEVRIAVSFTRCSGLGLLVDPLRELAERGGRAQVLTSTYQCITQPEALETLLGLPNVDTRVQSGSVAFHTKFWWFKGGGGAECWAGSSNLTKGGLATNLEWNLRSVDPARMAQTREQFRQLWTRPDVSGLDEHLIKRYRSKYLALHQAPAPSPLLVVSEELVTRPNDAQNEALGRLRELRGRGIRRAAIIAATGVGKTLLAAFDVEQAGARKVLYVSHRLEHLLQSARAFQRVLAADRTYGVVGGGRDEPDADVVFATIAGLRRRPELIARAWDYLIIDEFHHVEAKSYEVLRPIRERAFLLGLTATPERQDGHDVLEWCDWNIAYQVRLPEAIERGWLLPFHYFGIADDTVDFLAIPWRRLDEVEDALSIDARAAHILKHALERGFDGPKRATVGFCAGRRHAQFMADFFNRAGQRAVFVSGEDAVDARELVYRRLAEPRDPLSWLFVSDILNEGVDLPAINSVLFLRPTESATLFLQQLGRGLRLCPGTEVLTVLDFVGHHRSSWVTLQALDAPSGGGRLTELTPGAVIRPPADCEVVLQQRTREILAKVQRFTTKKEVCADAYARVREALGHPPLPIDLWDREDVPDFGVFRDAYGSWVACQARNGDHVSWANGLPEDHPALLFLRKVEGDWQMQRVTAYALVWGLCHQPDDPESGYEAFFARWPHLRAEYVPLADTNARSNVQKRLGAWLVDDRLDPEIRRALGDSLLPEVEGRLLYTVNSDYQTRHGGVLRTPADLRLYARYDRPEIIRHFGVQYDPTRHNTGVLWFDTHGVILMKLDTSTAKTEHQYENHFIDRSSIAWTSQNQMTPSNTTGRRVLDHAVEGRALHLFVQRGSHDLAVYLGTVTVQSHQGSAPMSVTFALSREVPSEIFAELTA
jgi:superfamily II DNA or RNA helicase/HKD family nuclease